MSFGICNLWLFQVDGSPTGQDRMSSFGGGGGGYRSGMDEQDVRSIMK